MSRIRRIVNVGCAAAACLVVLLVLNNGVGILPALGTALNPGSGVWGSAANGAAVHAENLDLSGLDGPVSAAFDSDGVPTVNAGSDSDLWLAEGYLHARFRFSEMDLERRLGEGRLAELQGPSGLSSDQFELQLGLLRTAQAEWATLSQKDPTTAKALTSYAAGVNDWLTQTRASGNRPAVYPLAGVYPTDWTPLDSLVVQEVLTQDLSFTTTALQASILRGALGPAAMNTLFPAIPPDMQTPTYPGPYRDLGTEPLAANANAASPNGSAGSPAPSPTTAALFKLPAPAVHSFPDSNAWAANGPKVAGGGAMLGGDPHLQTTLPAIWYELALHSANYAVAGASLPGVPGVLIGRDQHISWSITNASNQSTMYYQEQTSPAHPGQYYWDGAWRNMQQAHYTIPVRGAAPSQLTVNLTVHGPVLTQDGQTMAVTWLGNIPSPDLTAILAVDRATDFTEFRDALSSWRAPAQNFVYADDKGNIGAISPGYYPQFGGGGDPSLPLPGTGANDITGTIPYAAVPQVYDPPSHVIVSANQRPVGPDYPYYLGTALNNFDYGYRADEIALFLNTHNAMTPTDFAALQNSTVDNLARRMVPALLTALAGAKLTPAAKQAVALLRAWNDRMDVSSAGATVWWTYWSDYLNAVFQPWWAKVPVSRDPAGLRISPGQATLDENLEQWTLTDQHNSFFGARTAPQVMQSAFGTAIDDLTKQLGGAPASWTWGRMHSRQLPAISGADGLGFGPVSAGGDKWTVNAADDGMSSDYGPSWRMIVQWGGTSEAIYPGGQSEEPSSPWYQNFVPDWLNGTYRPMPTPNTPASNAITWTLRPGGDR
ncbi:MAG TPA: penicillin acylase family protein [Pseudonocardiaceae bacterium]